MIFKIRTSKRAAEIFAAIGASEHLQPFVLSKLAIAMSIKSGQPLSETDFKTDSMGLELNRQTITGEHDAMFKCLIEVFENRHIDEDEYFQKYLKAHLDRGAILLESSYKYGKDFLTHILDDDGDI